MRITHLPTGIVVSCQNEKSQLQNKAAALRVLQSRLLEKARQDRETEMNALKGDGGNSWGSQMRSYVLHPYQMVKDLRTEYEVSSPDAVFDGDIDGFIESGIRWRIGPSRSLSLQPRDRRSPMAVDAVESWDAHDDSLRLFRGRPAYAGCDVGAVYPATTTS